MPFEHSPAITARKRIAELMGKSKTMRAVAVSCYRIEILPLDALQSAAVDVERKIVAPAYAPETPAGMMG